MKTNILNYINKLQGYKTAIKNLHWSSKHMSEHKLLDDIADSVAKNQDEIAEMCQGIYGKIKLNELKPKRYNITNSKKMLYDILRDTKSFYSSIKGRDLSGVRSVVESFIGEINQFVYLMDMCLKEDIKRNMANSLTENKMHLTENELRNAVKLAIKNTLTEDIEKENSELSIILSDKKEYAEHIYNEYLNELSIIEQIVPKIIHDIQLNTEITQMNYEYDDYDNTIKITIGLNSQNFSSYEELEQLEREIWHDIENYRKYINFDINIEENNGNVYFLMEIEMPNMCN